MLKSLISDSKGFEPLLEISPEVEREEPWITVLVGENGTRKSLLLREVVELISDEKAAASHGLKKVRQVIALSGTPLDRFPRVRSARRRGTNAVPYTYFGQRASNGVVGTGQSARGIASVMLANRGRLANRVDELESIYGHFGLTSKVELSFRFSERELIYAVRQGTRAASSALLLIRKRIDDFLDSPSIRTDMKETEKFFAASGSNVSLKQILSEVVTAKLSARTRASTTGRFPIGVLRILFEAGVAELTSITFHATENGEATWAQSTVPGDFLSSGQWNWLSTLIGLALQVTDDSMVLIDEPENSLHPAWQRSYIPALLSVLSKHKRCQVLLATHAPLVASGLPPEAGNVRRLFREVGSDGRSIVRSVAAKNTFGWSASDAYEELFKVESSRAKIFTDGATHALEMIRKSSGTEEERTSLVKTLRERAASLPPLDPMRQVAEQIIASVDQIRSGVKKGQSNA